jgi:uncharacterized oxidoreductase
MNIENKTILVTGGGSGIGLEITKLLSEKGNRVIITGRNEAKLSKAASQFKNVTAIACDVTVEADVLRLVSKIEKDFGDLSVLINNAGVAHVHRLHQSANTFDIAQEEISINYLSVVRLTENLLPVLKKQKEAAIVNVTSIVVFAPAASIPTYSASKAALHAYTQILRHSLENTSVQVFELMPPLVNTDMAKEIGGEQRGMPASQVADALYTALQTGEFEIHVGMTAQLYQVFLSSPSQAYKVLNES